MHSWVQKWAGELRRKRKAMGHEANHPLQCSYITSIYAAAFSWACSVPYMKPRRGRASRLSLPMGFLYMLILMGLSFPSLYSPFTKVYVTKQTNKKCGGLGAKSVCAYTARTRWWSPRKQLRWERAEERWLDHTGLDSYGGNFIFRETPSQGIKGSDFCSQRIALTAVHRPGCTKVSVHVYHMGQKHCPTPGNALATGDRGGRSWPHCHRLHWNTADGEWSHRETWGLSCEGLITKRRKNAKRTRLVLSWGGGALCFVTVSFKWPRTTSKPRLGTNYWSLGSRQGQRYEFRMTYRKPIKKKGDTSMVEIDHDYKWTPAVRVFVLKRLRRQTSMSDLQEGTESMKRYSVLRGVTTATDRHGS